MTLPFAILVLLTIAGAAAALTLRNLVHCVLALTLGFVGLAELYLQLGAEFVGFAQILVYIGAVAILVVFAILLTRSAGPTSKLAFSPTWVLSSVTTAAVFAILAWAIHSGVVTSNPHPTQPEVTVKQIGDALMSRFALPLEVVGLLLTAALIGAVTIAAQDKREMK